MKKKKKSVCYKKFDEFPEGLLCCFCNTSINDSAKLGDIYKICDVIMHYFCLLSASEIEQRGDDKEALLGFYTRDIKKEIARGLGNTCFYCNKKGATVSCFDSSCDITFHLPCGLDHGSLHQYFDSFRSYCRKHKPKQAIPSKLKKNNLECPMCVTTVMISKEPFIWPPCCKPGLLLHKICCQKLASNSGYALKCPMCNNKDDFVKSLKKYGIFIPDQEASWELEEMNARNRRDPDIVECLAEKYDSTCKCPKGKLFSVKSSPRWYIEICVYCGGGMHLGCMPTPLSQGELYKCELCVRVDQGLHDEVNIEDGQPLSDCLRSSETENNEVLLSSSIADAQSEKKGLSKMSSQCEAGLATNSETFAVARTLNSPSVSCQSYNIENGSQPAATRSPSSTSCKDKDKSRPPSPSTGVLGAVTKTANNNKLTKRSLSSSTSDKKPVPGALPWRRKRVVPDKNSSPSEIAGCPTRTAKKPGCKAQLEIHDDILIIISSDSDSDSGSSKYVPSDRCRGQASDAMMLCTHTDMIRRKRGQLPDDVPPISVQLDYDDSSEDLPSVNKREGNLEKSKSSTTATGHQPSTRIESKKHEKSKSKNAILTHSDCYPLVRSESSQIKKSLKTAVSICDQQSSATCKSGNVEKLKSFVQCISSHPASSRSVYWELTSNNAISIDSDSLPQAGSKFKKIIDDYPTPQVMESKSEVLRKSSAELKLNIASVCSLPVEYWSQDNQSELPPFSNCSEVITLSSESEDESHHRSYVSNEENQVTKPKLAVTTIKRNTTVSSPTKKKTKHSDNKTSQKDALAIRNEIGGSGLNENINYPNHQFISSKNICHIGNSNSDEKRAVKKMRFTSNEKSRESHVESLTSEHLSYPLLAPEFPLTCISQDSRKRLSYRRDASNFAPTNSSLVSSVNNTFKNLNQNESSFKIVDIAKCQVKEIEISNNVGFCKETEASSSQGTTLVSNKFNFSNNQTFNDVIQKKSSIEEKATQDPLASGISFVEVSDSSQLLPILNNETSILSHENLYLSSDLNISPKECKNSFGVSSVLGISHEKKCELPSEFKSSTSLITSHNSSKKELSTFKTICPNEEENTSAFLNKDQNIQEELNSTTAPKCQHGNDVSLLINKSENTHLQCSDESSTNLTPPSERDPNLLLRSTSPIKNGIFHSSKHCSINEVVVNQSSKKVQDFKSLNEEAKETEILELKFDPSSSVIINENSIPEVLNNILNKICLEDNKNLREIEIKEKELSNSNFLTDKNTSSESYPIDGKQVEIIEKDRVQILCEKFGSTCLQGLPVEPEISTNFPENNISDEPCFDKHIAPPQWYPLCSYENCSTCKNSCSYINSISLRDNEVVQYDSEEMK